MNVSFRAAPRVLALFFASGQWVPHFTSAINWALRAGLGLLAQAGPSQEDWVAIIDHSIDVGTKKVLAVLRVRAAALAEKGSALALADCQCVGLEVSEKTDGETVAGHLAAVFAKCGSPVAIIKDNGSDLSRGVTLWKERSGAQTEIIYDVGHAVANALKAEYGKRKPFAAFLAIVARAGSRLRQTKLASLAPPKLRAKGRFQGILRLVDWAERIMAALDDARKDPEYDRLRKALAGLSKVKAFALEFAQSAIALNEAMKILKNRGLSRATYDLCKPSLEWLAPGSKLKARMDIWFEAHLLIAQRLGLAALPVSSDVIESLFGRFKAIQGRGSAIDMNRSVLLLPALCGAGGDLALAQALERTSQRDLDQWDQTNIPYTQNRKRRDFMRRGLPPGVPKAGNLNAQAG